MFNGRDLSDLVMVRPERPVMAPVEVGTQEVVGAPGCHCGPPRLSSYLLTVPMWLRVEGRREVAEARHRLAAALWSEGPAPLVLPDDPDRYLLAVVEGQTDLGEVGDGVPGFSVTFRVTDPVAYGAERTARISTAARAVDAGGTYAALPTVEAVPPAGTASWALSDRTTGASFAVAAPFDGAGTLVVDMATERATFRGSAVEVAPASEAIAIEGVHELAVSAGVATMRWRERWL